MSSFEIYFLIIILKAYHFDRDDVALPGLHHYFKSASDEERGHAMLFLKYMNKRGGRIIMQDIKSPDLPIKMTAVEAMTKALDLEKLTNDVRPFAQVQRILKISRNIFSRAF